MGYHRDMLHRDGTNYMFFSLAFNLMYIHFLFSLKMQLKVLKLDFFWFYFIFIPFKFFFSCRNVDEALSLPRSGKRLTKVAIFICFGNLLLFFRIWTAACLDGLGSTLTQTWLQQERGHLKQRRQAEARRQRLETGQS